MNQNSRGAVLLVVVIVLVLIGLGGAILIQRKPLLQPSPSTPAPRPTTSPTPSPTPLPGDPLIEESSLISGWKSYTFTDYSVSLPEGWRYRILSSNLKQFYNYELDSARRGHFDPELDKGLLKLEILKSEDNGKSLQEFVNERKQQTLDLWKQDFGWKEAQITVDEQSAIRVDTTEPGINVYVQNPYNSVFYLLSFGLDFDNFENLANQILSTFRFLK